MESVIADRQKGRHDRALNAAFDLVRLCRVMRRESYTVIGSLVARACEAIALNSVTMPNRVRRPRLGAPLATFQSDPRTLYFYAKSQKRPDITRFLDAEWVELGKWQKAQWLPTSEDSTGSSTAQTMTIIAAERFGALVVKVLPSILILGAIFALMSRRFRDASGARGAFWRGAWFGSALLVLAMICDAIIALRSFDPNWGSKEWTNYLGGAGLLSALPSWVWFGMAGATVGFALNRAVAWQKAQTGQQIPLTTRLKNFFEAPDDGLTRFDFGWILGFAARLTGWILLWGGVLMFCAYLGEIEDDLGIASPTASVFLMASAFFFSFLMLQSAWRTRPRRRQTLRLGFRLAAGALAGFFVTCSVLYALVAFAVWPLSLRYERNFESAMQRGELVTARARLGL